MKKVLLLLMIFTLVYSCEKDEASGLTAEEQSVVDNDKIVEYMKSHKFISFHEGNMVNNIDWKAVDLEEGDTEDMSIYNLMSSNVIETEYDGVSYKMYYYLKDKNVNGEVPEDESVVYVDYNVFNLGGEKTIDASIVTAHFGLSGLIEGWKLGMKQFTTGDKPSVFPGEKLIRKKLL